MSARPFHMTSKRRDAALLVAIGELTQEAVAKAVKVSDRSLRNWMREEVFAKAVEAERAAIRERLLTTGIADRVERLKAYQERWVDMRAVVVATRNADGKPITVDTYVARELRELEKQAAIEVGDWAEKREVTGAGGKPLAVVEVPSDPERAAAVIQVLAEAGVITPEGGDG